MRTILYVFAVLFTLAVSQGANAYERWLKVHNQTSVDVCGVYISHVDKRKWGRNLLTTECIWPGHYIKVDPGYQQGYCMMDMKFVWADGREGIRYDFNICDATDHYLVD